MINTRYDGVNSFQSFSRTNLEEQERDENSSEFIKTEDMKKLAEIIPLDSREKKLMKKSSCLIKGASKVDDYIKERADSRRRFELKASLYVGGISGAGIGFAGGTLIGYLIFQTPVGGIGGGIFGAIIGAITGHNLAKMCVHKVVVCTEDYQEYYSKVTEKVIKQYQEFEGISEFREFFCPINFAFIVHPVKYPKHKTVYEYEAIIECLSRNPTGNNSPTREGHMKVEKLEYDFTYFPRLAKKINEYAEKIFEQEKQSCFKTILEGQGKARDLIISRAIVDISKLRAERQISRKAHEKMLKFLEKEREKNENIFNKILINLSLKK